MKDIRKEVGWFGKATHVTTAGKILQLGQAGVIVFDETGKVPLLAVDEVSDDETINVFLRPAEPLVKGSLEPGEQVWEILADQPSTNEPKRCPHGYAVEDFCIDCINERQNRS